MKVLCYAQGPSDARPKMVGEASAQASRLRSWQVAWDWYVSTGAYACLHGSRWWLVECANADAGREVIEDCGDMDGQMESDLRGECEGPTYDSRYPGARILASGGANKEVAR